MNSVAVARRSSFQDYPDQLRAASERTGWGEAVITGTARVNDMPLALILTDFGFMGGSMGIVAGDKIAKAFDRARRFHLPIIASLASGGIRMQEGTAAFMQVVKVAAAVARYRDSGGLYVVYLRHPTTGGIGLTGGLGPHNLWHARCICSIDRPSCTPEIG